MQLRWQLHRKPLRCLSARLQPHSGADTHPTSACRGQEPSVLGACIATVTAVHMHFTLTDGSIKVNRMFRLNKRKEAPNGPMPIALVVPLVSSSLRQPANSVGAHTQML